MKRARVEVRARVNKENRGLKLGLELMKRARVIVRVKVKDSDLIKWH